MTQCSNIDYVWAGLSARLSSKVIYCISLLMMLVMYICKLQWCCGMFSAADPLRWHESNQNRTVWAGKFNVVMFGKNLPYFFVKTFYITDNNALPFVFRVFPGTCWLLIFPFLVDFRKAQLGYAQVIRSSCDQVRRSAEQWCHLVLGAYAAKSFEGWTLVSVRPLRARRWSFGCSGRSSCLASWDPAPLLRIRSQRMFSCLSDL